MPVKMTLGVSTSAPLHFGSDVTLQSPYGVLPDINHRGAVGQQTSQQTSNFGLSIISAPAPIVNRQPDHQPACHSHHFRHAEDAVLGVKGHRSYKAANL